MSDQRDDQNRSETSPFDRGPSSGQSSWNGGAEPSAYGQQPWDQQSPAQQPPAAYGQQPYGSPAPYGDPYAAPDPYGQQYGQQQYGQQQYGQQYTQQQYGYGAPAPAKPGGVVTAAVLGFVFGALGVLVSGLLLIGGAIIVGAGAGASDLDAELPGFGTALGGAIGAIAGLVVVIGLLALVWTVLTIWGSVWALSGRSRVLLIVAGSISILVTGIGLVGNLSNSGSAGDVVVSLLFFAGAVAIVVLLSLSSATQFYAAHRARRGG